MSRDGKILGIFWPNSQDPIPELPTLSEEELERQRTSGNWMTTEQMIERLKKSRS